MKKLVIVLSVLVLVFSVTALAQAADGEKLERTMWAAMKAKDWAAVEKMIAPGFQASHDYGVQDRAAEIKLIKGLNLGEVTLADFKVTQNGPAMVVTYTVAPQHETIEGKTLPTTPAQRLSVWLKTDQGWQWIAHVNLAPVAAKAK